MAGSLARFGLIGLLALALGALLLFSASPVWAQAVDYDTDGDNLIEVSNLAQLNAIRHDLDGNGDSTHADYTGAFPNALASMGCAATCTGYELEADLDFDTHGDDDAVTVADTYWNGGDGWEPLGDSGPNPFRTTFEGNNHTISNLFINVAGNSDNYIGLFGQLGGATVTRVHLVDAKVTGNNDVGALVGHITLGTVSHSSSSGTVSGVGKVGGLVGAINSSSGVVEYSRSSAVVTATGKNVGGLVGYSGGTVRVSYATGAVTGLDDVGGLAGYSPTSLYAVYATGAVTATGSSNAQAGGLVGASEGGIYASYSTGAVTSASGHAGGLLNPSGSGATVGHSYWDVTTTGIADDNNADTGVGKTTRDLQMPTQTDGYAGIYANWNLNLDGDASTDDDPWDFGTASQYPALKADEDGDGRATAYEFGRQGRSAPVVDYDLDDDGLIEVADLDQLNAMRWDLDGDGAPDVANANDYALAFPNPATGMGCPITATDADDNDCTGYELDANLDFNTDTGSDSGGAAVIDAADDYYNSGSGWEPIGDDSSGRNTWYNAIFEGNGHTISNLFISRAHRWVGLFGISSEAGFFRNVGLVDVNVTGWGYTGALIGHAYGTVDAAYSTGIVVSNKLTHVGGLVGHLSENGSIQRSYSTASVTGFGTRLGGLVGTNRGPIRASYATGAVAGSSIHSNRIGGLVGESGGDITASYATGSVTGAGSDKGGLIGELNKGTITNSYWDVTSSGIADDSDATTGVGKTTLQLQSPAQTDGYAGIYADWDIDVDNADVDDDTTTETDDPWDFGTASEYPALKVEWDGDGTPTAYEFGRQGRSAPGVGPPANGPPVFTPGYDDTPNIAEGVTAVGTYAATDPEGDQLTYAVTGTDASDFAISGAGALTLASASNHETKESYSVNVTVHDGKNAAGGADTTVDLTLAITVTVDDTLEPPTVPTSLGVVPAANGLTVTWTAPVMPSTKPALDDYDVQHALRTSGDGDPAAWAAWVAFNHVGTGTTATITGLVAGSTYQVQVMAKNNEGESAWTAAVNGVPAAPVDYDLDDDGLIEVDSLTKLNAIRWDLDGDGAPASASAGSYAAVFPYPEAGMGCPITNADGDDNDCTGYELTADLDFDQNNDKRITSADAAWWNSGAGWAAIGNWGAPFNATFDGGGHTVSHMYIRVGGGDVGLFGSTDTASVIRNLGMVSPSIDRTGSLALDSAAAVAGSNRGTIDRVFVTGGSIWAYAKIGGVAGHNRGTVSNSYSRMTVTGNTQVGGLVGWNETASGIITNSYAAGGVATHGEAGTRGGVSGTNAAADFGGLVGQNSSGAAVTASYWDTEASGQAASAAGAAQTTAGLQSPTGATGIYSAWGTVKWDFGTTSEYPALKYDTDGVGGATWQEFGGQVRIAPVDYDTDDDGLIEVDSLAKLNAIRYDLNGDGGVTPADKASYDTAFPNAQGSMGCLNAACAGYELTDDLNFDQNNDNAITSDDAAWWNSGAGWAPIGDWANPFNATFDGRGHTISNLYIRIGGGDVGLFGSTDTSSVIRNLGMVNPSIDRTGALTLDSAAAVAGSNRGAIQRVFVSGGSIWAFSKTGGLVGHNRGAISDSYSRMAVTGNTQVGGLVGWNENASGTITNSYAMGKVATHGLTGTPPGGGSRQNPIADVGGLVGKNDGGATVTAGYWDTEASRQSASAGGAGAVGQTTAGLQSPTGATGIYLTWAAATWDFGTASQYPALKYDTNGIGGATWQEFGSQARAAPPPPTDYDTDDDGLIEVDSLAQLNAIRYDLDGNGAVTAANQASFDHAFPNAAASMGCAGNACTGYELTDDLDFDTDDDGDVDSSDDYPSWTAIGAWATPFTATFDGGGHTISNMRIRAAIGDQGLFGSINSPGVLRNVAVLDVDIDRTGSPTFNSIGGLLGSNRGAVEGSYSTGAVTGFENVGGLVGDNRGVVTNSYSSVTVNGNRAVGGLVGFNRNSTARITNSYAVGAVSAVAMLVSGGNSAARTKGGLVGEATADATVTAGYWDATTSAQAASAGGAGAVSQNTAGLQSPTSATGIYSTWAAATWDFGTSSQYPALKYDTDKDSTATAYEFGRQGRSAPGAPVQPPANAPPVFDAGADATPNVAEGATAVGTYAATDPDSDTLTYAVTGTDAAAFAISGAGVLTLNDAANHETKPRYSVSVTVHDGKNAAGANDATVDITLALTVTVDDTLEPPTAPTNLQVFPVVEGLRVTWTAPVMPAAKPPLSDYDVQHSLRTSAAGDPVVWGAWLAFDHVGTGTTATITGLTAGSTYQVQALAKNAEGSSPWTAAVNGATLAQSTDVDYDSNDDGLIEVGSLKQLHATRWDPDGDGAPIAANADDYALAFPTPVTGMGCPDTDSDAATSNCLGYELTADLDFDEDGNGVITSADAAYWNDGLGWDPLGVDARGERFTATFDGKGHRISNLYINRPAEEDVGLWATLGDGAAVVRNLGLERVSVTGGEYVGAFTGSLDGTLEMVYATGSVRAARSATDPPRGNFAGGLAGYMATSAAAILDSYANVAVTADVAQAGGLVGSGVGNWEISRSYARGRVSSAGLTGGIIARAFWFFSGTTADNYWDTEASGHAVADEHSSVTAFSTGKTTAELQAPVDTTSDMDGATVGVQNIYANWDAAKWDFGTNSQYPALKFDTDESGSATSTEFGSQSRAALTTAPVFADGAGKTLTVPENTRAGVAISGSPTATDADAGDWLTYALEGADAAHFTIHRATGQISTKTVLDYESNNQKQVRVVATDGTGRTAGIDVNIDVTNVVEGATDSVDYDTDDDGLIEVDSLEKLDAMRWDLDGDGVSADAGYLAVFTTPAEGLGCPNAVCSGYELDTDLTFDSNADGTVDASDHSGDWWDSGAGWAPIGTDTNGERYTAAFDGNGHTISHLFIARSATHRVGLFGAVEGNSAIENVGLENVDVTGHSTVGALAGAVRDTSVKAVYATGSVTGFNAVGGLFGFVADSTLERSYSTAAVTGTGEMVGGLIGMANDLSNLPNVVRASYATGNVSGGKMVGGLIGRVIYGRSGANRIVASYAAGAVSGSGSELGGLIGAKNSTGQLTVSNSYWDVTTTGIADDSDPTTGVGKTTSDLQTPEDYGSGSDIYANWNLNLDGDANTDDDPWDFGADDDYPALKVEWDGDGTPSAYEFGRQGRSPAVDYDTDGDNLIEVSTLAQLNAIRHDLDGNGDSTHADYTSAFLNAASGMGCAANCLGYELTADLDFDTNGSGTANSGDTYWNTGAGWTPIGDHPNGTGADGYTAVFEGNGHTVANLFINQPAVDRMGLFGTVGETGVLRNLALVDADVTGKRMVGTLAGYVWGTVKLSYATGSVHAAISAAGGLVGVTKPTSLVSQSYAAVDASATLDEVKAQVQTVGTYVGGLVGQLQGRVEVSYATGSVSGQQGVGGLVGWFVTGAVEASYSTGRVQGNDRQGGLVGNAIPGRSAGTVTNSYWDTRTSGQTSSAGGTGKTTIELMTPTAYGSGSDIYANWNLDLDGDTNSDDDPWDFGTASEYPALKADWDGNSATAATAAEFGSQARTAPIFADGTSTTVAVVESAPANQDIPGSPAARGPAAGDTLTYALSGTDAGHFDIDAGSGQLKTRGALERAVKTSYSVVVTATYGSGASDSITVTINVAVDYDTDSDGLIEVSSLDQLDAIRRDLDGDGGSTYASYARAFLDMAVGMGCPDTDLDADTSNCLGYELMRNLDFDTHGDDDAVTDADTWWNDGDGWHPLGGAVVRGAANPKYEAIFEGNGFTISNMLINLPNRQGVGLFGALDTDGVIRNLGLVNATVTAKSVVGPLAGLVAGTVESSYATGSVTGSGNNVGGLVGSVPAGGRVLRSYTTASVSSSGTSVGGLAGFLGGTIKASYAAGNISGSGTSVGGLVGEVNRGTVTASYARGEVQGANLVGGLVGRRRGSVTVTDSYWDTETSGQGSSVRGVGKTTSELRTPAQTDGYAGIYANWNLDLDGDSNTDDDPWDFGTGSEYPALKVEWDGDNTPSAYEFGRQGRSAPAANGAPTFGVVGPYTPDENQTAVGTIPVATDPDAGATLTYEMMMGAGDGDHALFTFVPGTRVLTFKAAPNFEATPTKTTYTVKIRVRDSLNAGGTADTGWDDTVTVTINLQNVNEAPTFGVVGPYTPDENQTAVGTIPVATDPDAGATLTYEMMMGAGDGDHALFTFVPGTRVLTFKAAPNFEATPTKTTYTVKIRVRDSLNAGGTADTGWDDTVTVTINLQNVNEAPTFGVVGPYTPDENQTAVGTIPVATDPDAGATLTYQMMEGAGDGDHALFTFVPGTRVLTFKAAPNFEATPTKTTYTVKIRVRDSLNAGGTADTGWDDTVTVTINLQNVNEAPTFGVVGPYTPDENQTAVGTIPVATDPDAGATLTYQMMEGAGDGDHALFTFVPGTRVLTFKNAPNFENPPLSKTTYTVKIRVRDSLNAGGTADTGWDDTVTVTINLQNVNEAPAFGVVGPYTPDENQTAVGTIPVATDPDAGATLTYEMMMGAGDGDHALFTFVPGTRVLTFKAAPNFEATPTKTTYTVKIRVRDSLNAGGTADTGWDDTVTVTINLQNVNEAPTFGVVGPYTPDENQTAVGTIPVATDPDAGATLTYQMMEGAGDGDHALFTFVPGTRVLTFKAAPNFEATPTKTTYTVKIRVRDSLNAGGTADTGWDDTVTVTINLQNVNEAPTFGVVGPYTPDENQTAVGTIPVATDPDAGATLTYQMMEGAGDGDHALFTFVPGTRVLTFKNAPNFENPPLSKTTYTVKIRVRDSLNAGGTADTGWDDTVTVTINLQNVNEAPAFGVVGPYTPDENQTAVGTIPVATDPDAGATLTYQMLTTTGDHALFTFVPGTRALTFKNAPNFEAKDSYTVSIQVRDSLNAAGVGDTAWDDTVVVTINLQDVNEEPEFMSTAYTDSTGTLVPPAPIATDTRSFREDAAADAAIGAPVAATDPDTEVDPLDTLTYALAASGDHASFAIDTATGQLKTKAGVTYDYEAKDTYTVTVTVHDGKNAAAAVDATVDDTITVTINVTDALERWTPPTGLNIDVVTLANRIRVTWTAPAAADNTGKPALTGYKVEWRQKRTASAAWAPDWVDFPRTGLGVMNDITTYTVTAADGTTTTYTVATGGGRINEVRVCSLNTDGAKSTDSPKAEQCGSWNGNALPAFTEGTKASRSVAENTPANTNIGNPIAAADSDAGDTLVYSMTQGTHSAKFTIDTATGQLKTKDPLDHETAGSYDVYVKVNDGNNGIDGIMVTITVTDVNEPPAFDDGAGPTTRSVSEGAAAGDAIGDPVEATDPDTKADPLDTLTYALDTTTGDHANFEIDTGTGQLKVKDALDYETKSSYTVTVQVRDSLSAAGVADTVWDDTIVVNISVGDVNEAPAFATNADTTPNVAEGATAVGTYAATDQEGDTLTYGLSGTDASDFAISGAGALTLDTAANHETKPSYSVNVRVRDSRNAAGTADTAWDTTLPITVTVTDALEPPTAPTGVGVVGIANGLRVTWTAPVMTNKPTLDGYDVEYSLRTAVAVGATTATWGAAVITDAGLVLTHDITGLTPDSTYRVRVRAKNAEGISGWSSYDTGVPTVPPLVNADPTFGEGADTSRSVPENTAAGTAIGNPIAATDTDASDTLVYAIDATTGDHAHFAIDTGTGQLKAKGALDYESGTISYSIKVTVSDGNGGTDSITVTITVTSVNEAPVFTAGAGPLNRSVAENAGANANVGLPVPATDVDDGDSVTLSLSGTGANLFSIDSNGQIKAKASLDYETAVSYAITVTATDTSSATDTILVNISVTDVDEPPTAPTGVAAGGIANGLRVTWTAPVMTNKPTLDGYDVEYSLRTAVAVGATTATWGAAVITDAGLVLTHDITGLTPDSTYRVRVRAKNAEGISGWSSYDTGVPTMPPLVNADPTFGEGADTSRSVPENTAAGTAIGNPIAATDTDASDTLVYAIDATTGDHAHFAIDSTNGQLKVKSALDYESNNRYTVVVTVSDGNGGTDSITVTIDVDDVVNEAPVVVPPQANVAPSFDEGASASRNVAENTPAGRNIGSSVGATDHDNDVLRYELEATGDHGHFAIDSSSGQLKTKGALDYESKSSYAVTVIVWDGNGGTDSIPVTIRVTNVDDTPTVTPTPVAPTGTLAFDKVGVARRTVDAYAPVGTAVGAPITATVSAGMAGPFYSVYTRSSPFIVDRLTGQLRTARKLGPADEYTIQLLATDGKGRLDVIGVIITVTGGRANRDPVFREGASATRSVVAGSSQGVRVGRPVTATDPDGDALFYMVSGTDSSHFSIGSGSGQIKVGRPLTKSSYSFEVVVGDLKGGVDVLDITITVTAVDAPPVATTPTPTPNRAPSFDEGASAGRSVAENTAAGRNIGLPLAATDPDSDSLTYALGGTDSGHFVLSGNRLRTSGALDYEGVKNSYAVTVTVSDGRGGTDTIDVTITVTNVNEAAVVAPTPANRAPSFDEGASAGRSVAENTASGQDIGLPLTATDADGDSLTYALGGTDSGHFALSGNQLRTSGDYAGVKSSYSVTVYVSDGRGGTDSIDVTVTVINVDEAPVEPTPQANRAPSFDEGASAGRSVAENTAAGRNIGLPLAATDPEGDPLTYALGGADSGHFALSGNRLQTSGALDYEGQNSYAVTVTVSDARGGTDTIDVTITVTNVDEPPGALPGLGVFEEVNGLRLSWSAPDMRGKPPVTGYDVQYKLITATTWNDHAHSGAGTTIQGLTAGSTYKVRVRAKNAEGNSVWASAQGTPTAAPVTPVPPGATTNLEVTPGYSKLWLTWNMPDMTGKPPITHFEVQYKLSIDKYWLDFPHDSTVRRVTIDFLGGGLSYDVRVRAVNSAGSSDWVSSSGTTK